MSDEPNAAAVDAAHDAIMSIMTDWLAETIDEKALARAAVEAILAKGKVAEALRRARDVAMRNVIAARIPECGEFGEIAQDLDWVLSHWMPLPPAPAKEPKQ